MTTDFLPQTKQTKASTFVVTENAALHRSPSLSSPRTRGWGRPILFASVAIAVVGGATMYLRGGVLAQPLGSKLTHTIARSDLQVTVTEEGSLESSSNKEIKCRVRGGSTVLWIIKAGTPVKPGDVLVKLDTKVIDDNINAQRIKYQNALAVFAQSESDVAIAKINIQEYLEGTFRTDKQTLKKDIKIAESQLLAAQNLVLHTTKMNRKGFTTELQLKSDQDSAEHKQIELDVLHTKLDVLERYTKAKKIEELNGILKAKEAKMASDQAGLKLEKDRLDREEDQLPRCNITAETSGMVIYPVTEQWKNQPNIEEGATVREDQVLLVIPDLDQMQVKLGVHEAYVDRMKLGMPARVKLQEEFVDGEVLSVASVTRPAGWWNGNQVKYDTLIKLKSQQGLKPGMSASVEVFLARHNNVLTIPVAAVVEQEGQFFCWVKTAESMQRRRLDLGDSNDQFIVVNGGVKEGDEVVLNPRAVIQDAQIDALKPVTGKKMGEPKLDAKGSEKAQ
ncbi:MAG: efflux RND transporter periplasmic adaptor subunit [Planctomycetota bacterium]|nr:MAG: efflux RND transporter periplasmic adaptor subunit [Planctomycetota bacterium]